MTTSVAAVALEWAAPENFVDGLQRLARDRPGDTALTVVGDQDGQASERVLSYQAFATRVQALAAGLQAAFAPGDRLLILLDNDEHYAVSMFACFYAGMIAVPAFPPESTRPQHLERLVGMAADARASGILTASDVLPLVEAAAAQLGPLRLLAVDRVDDGAASGWRAHRPGPGDVAFLQYTSGSTSAPKGVMVTHGNLMANQAAIREGFSIGDGDRIGVWSPLFHDMGLIGGLLQPFYSGIPCVLCSPRYFLERPVRWLQLVSRHRVTISGGPDFAYRLCLDRVKPRQLEGLDLSCWRVAYTGAEPVREDTMSAFIERHAPAGFQARAVLACYGLAEATLYVAGARRDGGMVVQRFDAEALARRHVAADGQGVALVGCGGVARGHALRIADPETGEPLGPDAIGEIWAAGPSIAAGYWGRPEASDQAFVERDGRRWLRTGDLGFCSEGQLMVSGRLKDMVIVRGHNIYPQDVERAVETEVEAVRKGRVAAFAVQVGGQEGVGVAAEVSYGLQKLVPVQALVDGIGSAVAAQCGQSPAVVVLLNPGALPKTSSGKLQRQACRAAWTERRLDAYALYEDGRWVLGSGDAPALAPAAVDRTHAALAALWREVLGHGPERSYAADAHFFSQGGNSMAAVELAARISRQWGIEFPVRELLTHGRLGEQARRVQAGIATGAGLRSIARRPAGEADRPVPLSAAQQRQWFLWQMDPRSSAYHVQGALRLGGRLDPDALQASVLDLAARHDALRMVLQLRADGEVEQIAGTQGPAWESADLGGQGPQALQERLAAFAARPFDLRQGPLARALLVRLADQDHVLALALHHIVCDGASMHILVNELALLYAARRALAAGGPAMASLPAPALQYADYARWARENEAGHKEALAYWVAQLGMPPGQAQPVLALPTDRPRRALARWRAAQHRFALPPSLVADLRALAQARGATLFMLLLSAFQVLLARYTGQQDLRVGVPVANRLRPELQDCVGLFVNTVVLRARIDPQMRCDQVLDQTRQAVLQAQAHQELPLEQLVQTLQPERSLSHSPLFQVVFNHLLEDHGGFERHTDLAVQTLDLPEQAAQFELMLDTREHGDGRVSVCLGYAQELFDADRIQRMGEHLVAVLQSFARQPGATVRDLVLLSPGEAQQLAQWGHNGQRHPDTLPVHRLIERQAALRPQATALVLGAERLGYGELERRANRLAHRLIALGVRPEQRVGLALERSLDMVVGLLAILKAGGAFVALDPQYPAQRLRPMVEDSGIRLVLVHGHLHQHLAGLQGLQLLAWDETAWAGESDAAPALALHGDQLAYVIHTSGSSGRPKGVAVAHRALVEHAQLAADFSRLVPEDKVLQFATLNFDSFIEQLFSPLLAGACVVLRGPGIWGAQELVQVLRGQEVSVVDLSTPYWFALIQTLAADGGLDCPRLREVHVGGEAMPAEALPVWRAIAPADVKLFNIYGPTEAVVGASLFDCAACGQGEDAPRGALPIGRPLAGRSLHVLDAQLQPVPVGVAGELYIGGPLLARGYLQRPGLSAHRFVADPFDGGGARLYRTGDQVRWSGQGQLEYLGRLDFQTKIRGFRIELGEVEAQLLAQPEVREAVAVADGDRLIAYVSLQPGQDLHMDSLRARLVQALPDYMVPALVMALDRLPLQPSGKVDRQALPAPARAQRAAGFEAPQGEVEQRLERLWSQALGVERVGRRDNFFEAGGHSLMLLGLHRQLEAQGFAATPSVVDLFRYPTIEALAAFIATGPAEAGAGPDIAERAQRQRQAFLPRAARNPGMQRTDV
jgi:amino acid adenylation domain-containing protein